VLSICIHEILKNKSVKKIICRDSQAGLAKQVWKIKKAKNVVGKQESTKKKMKSTRAENRGD
jgi:hypothetical protein